VEKVVCDEKWRKSLMTPCFVASTRNCTTAAQTLKMLDESRVKNESTWAQVRKLTETSPGQAPRLPASHWARRPHPDYQNANKIAWWPAFQKKAASVAPSAASVALPAPTLGTRPKAASAAPPAASADRSRSPRPVFFLQKFGLHGLAFNRGPHFSPPSLQGGLAPIADRFIFGAWNLWYIFDSSYVRCEATIKPAAGWR